MFSEIRRTYGRLDHVINNAGIASMNHSLLTPKSSVDAILNTNVVGTFLLSREGQELALKQGYVPAHPHVALPPGFPDRADIRLMSFDPARALADAKANTKRFSDIFGP